MRKLVPRARRSRVSARLCFVTDVHGSERCFKKFLNAGKFYDVQYLILGGDITGKTLVPIERSRGGWWARYNDHEYVDLTERERDELVRTARSVEFVEGRCVRLDDKYELITTGYSNITPWHSPREEEEDQLARRIDAMFAEVEDPANLVAVLHCPPRGTELDQAPVVDSELRVKMSGGDVRMGPVGSTAVSDFIREHQPLLGLHGHVHESKAAQRLGRTLCLNPGSEYTAGILNCAIVTLYDEAEPEYQFTSG